MVLGWGKSQRGQSRQGQDLSPDPEERRSQIASRVLSQHGQVMPVRVANEELTEPQAHTAIVVDRSGSMLDYLRELNEQLDVLRQCVMTHPVVSVRARIGIWAFGGRVECLQPFASALAWQPTMISTAWGGSPVYAAAKEVAAACEQGRAEMRALGLDCFRHQVIFMSDFDDTNPSDRSACLSQLQVLQAMPANRGLSLHAIAFGNSVNEQVMRDLTPNPPIRITSATDISELFCWLLKSMTRVACSRVADGVDFSTIQVLDND